MEIFRVEKSILFLQWHVGALLPNKDIFFINCMSEGSSNPGFVALGGVGFETTGYVKFKGCVSKNNGRSGFYAAKFDTAIVEGCISSGNADDTGGHGDSIRVIASKSTSVIGNTIIRGDVTNSRHPISTSGTDENVLIANSNAVGYTDATIYSPKATIKNNIGLKPDVFRGESTLLSSRDFFL